ncbi:PF20097 family protein [Planctomycetota bacterium]
MAKPKQCSSCKHRMEVGFILGWGNPMSRVGVKWVEGKQEINFLGQVKTKDRKNYPMEVYCCPKCGRLEFYANH